MDAKVSADTRLTYVTTGVLLEKLVAEKNMNKFTHVILDEVITSVSTFPAKEILRKCNFYAILQKLTLLKIVFFVYYVLSM